MEEALALNPIVTNKIVPLSIEPTSDQSAAIATVLIQMPKCTSEPRCKPNFSSENNVPEPPLVNLIEQGTSSMSGSSTRSSSNTPTRRDRSKHCDIIPVTVGGGNSQTLSFGCVLVNTTQVNKSKLYVRHNTKNLLVPNRNA